MNRNKKILAILLVAGIGVGMSLHVQQTRPIVKKVISGIGEFFGDILPGFVEKSFDKTVGGFKSVGKFVEDAFKRIAECLEVVGLGTQWASQKATFEAGESFLSIADELSNLDPRVVGTVVGEKVVDLGSEAVGTVLKGVEVALGKGINLEKAGFKIGLGDLIAGKVPEIVVQGVIAGQKINVKVKGKIWDPKEIPKIAQRLASKIIEKMPGFGDIKDLFS